MDRTVEGLRITIEAGVATLTIDRPDVRNAMTYDMWAGMAAELRSTVGRFTY